MAVAEVLTLEYEPLDTGHDSESQESESLAAATESERAP